MSPISLKDRNVAILATNGFEESELLEPRRALLEAGATVKIVSLTKEPIKSWKHTEWGESVAVDLTVAEARAADFDALVLPGGVMNPDRLRMDENAIAFIREIGEAGKPIAAICHGPWTLINADLVQGRQLTSWPSLQADLTNAGAHWMDREVVVDQGLVTSRKPADLPAFNQAMLEEFAPLSRGAERIA
jgi:protease I